MRSREAHFRNLIEQSSDWIWEVDAAGRYTYASPQVEQILGYAPEELLGRTPFDLMPAGEVERVQAAFLEAMSSGVPLVALENVNLHRDGRHVDLETSGVPFFDERGTLLGYRGVDRDISRRTRTLEALQESETRLRMAQQRAKLGCWEYNLATDQGWWSEQMYALFGRDPAVGPPHMEEYSALIHPDDIERNLDAHKRAFETGAPLSVEVRTHPKRGPIKHLSIVVYLPAGEAGSPEMAGTVLDVTERTQLQEQLRQAETMEAVGRLAGGVAHDVNNMLSGIMAHASLLQHDLGATHPHAEHAEKILAISQRARRFTGDLVGFARKGRYRDERIDLNEIVSRVRDSRMPAEGSPIVFEFRVAEHLPPIQGDPGQIEHALTNVCLNAEQALEAGGTVTVRTREVICASSGPGGTPVTGRCVEVAVTDTGVGMDAETLRRAFEPFYTTRPQGQGSGLGLAMVYGTVKNHGGDLALVSEPGRGTTVTLRFPVSEPVG